MKKIFFFIFFGSFVAASSQTVSNFVLDDIQNKSTDFKTVQGEKFTVVDFWASWCKPCLKAIPELIKIQEEFDAKGVKVVGINADGPRSVSKVGPLANTLQINYPVLLDFNGDVSRDFNVSNLPTIFIVDANNKIVWYHEGYAAGDDELIKNKLNELLAK
ncbi:MAG: TlpA disulfide reductase family protein [Bacteroidetes bacterium]|nr:TlpA disulfide reductase family protein [Bacteroidota bacterium]